MNKSLDVLSSVPRDLYIGGRWIPSLAQASLETHDPSSGQPIAEVASGDAADDDAAVYAAQAALSGEWGSALPAARARVLIKIAELLRRDAKRFALVETLDSGKPIRESIGDVETSARYFEYYSGIADKLQGDTIPLGRDFVSYTLREPLGVAAHIIPWNFPLVTIARGLAPCLAAGCTAVVKPAEQTPLTALMLADVLQEAGLPAGAYNVVNGTGVSVGAPLVAHPGISHVTFTGSVVTGKSVMKGAAEHVASVLLELGGKSPVIVLADADVDAALQGVLKAIFTNAGQVCSAGSRLIIERRIAEPFLDRLVKATAGLTPGRGVDDPALGPLISPEQLNRVASYVDGAARAKGCSLLTGGERLHPKGLENGWFFAPTIITVDDIASPIVQEEVFGPVLAVQIAEDAEDALRLANGTAYGLVAGIYTSDITRALRIARDVDAGQVFINQYFAGGVETPFGGTKNSGFGREKGLDAVRNYLRVKTVTVRL